MRTKEEYIKGLGKMRRNIYFNGDLIDRTDERHPGIARTPATARPSSLATSALTMSGALAVR